MGPVATRPRRRPHAPGYAPTMLVGLLSAVGVTVGVARPWASAAASQPGLPALGVDVSGATLVPLAGALGVVLLAAFGAVIATRGRVRRGLGWLIVLGSVAVAVSAIHPPGVDAALQERLANKGWSGGDYSTGSSGWRWLVLLSSVGCAVAGAAVVGLGGRWAHLGEEYDAPATPTSPHGRAGTDPDLTEADLWREIDQGRDPTQTP